MFKSCLMFLCTSKEDPSETYCALIKHGYQIRLKQPDQSSLFKICISFDYIYHTQLCTVHLLLWPFLNLNHKAKSSSLLSAGDRAGDSHSLSCRTFVLMNFPQGPASLYPCHYNSMDDTYVFLSLNITCRGDTSTDLSWPQHQHQWWGSRAPAALKTLCFSLRRYLLSAPLGTSEIKHTARTYSNCDIVWWIMGNIKDTVKLIDTSYA